MIYTIVLFIAERISRNHQDRPLAVSIANSISLPLCQRVQHSSECQLNSISQVLMMTTHIMQTPRTR